MRKQPASTIDLIILGFLLDKAMNAYELANFIIEKHVGRFLKISPPTIYKSCKRLYEEDLLKGEKVKEGELPEKTVYRVTKKGKERFFVLMEQFSSNFTPYFLDCNAFIWNIEKVERKRGLEMLRNLQGELLSLKKWISQHEKEKSKNMSFASKAIVKQYRMTISILLKWSEETIRDYKQLK